MKKIYILFFVLFAFATVSCTVKDTSAVGIAIADAQKLSHAELVEKAKEEIGTNTLEVLGNSSLLGNALTQFTADTGIKAHHSQKNDEPLYAGIAVANQAGQYMADMILAQDGNSLQTVLLNDNYVSNFIPKDYKSGFDNDDFAPATATLYLNKVFMYNNSGNTEHLLKNVWQLAGTEADTGHLDKFSFKKAGEQINTNFLIMLTSPAWVTKLTAAYKSFYGKDYVKETAFSNIGYKWIYEFLKNSNTHSSDTDVVKAIPDGVAGNGALANWNKIKDVSEGKRGLITVAGIEQNHIEGFDGFVYKMYSVVSKYAKYPYAAAALISYLSSPEGYAAGWGGKVGYYSVNKNAAIAANDKDLAFWKENCVIEDPLYVAQNYSLASRIISVWSTSSN